ncbi:4420_t:CDS:2, partial [Gigaspora margarita]
IKKLNQKFKRVLTWSKQEVVEETWWSDSETSDLLNLDNLNSVKLPKWGKSIVGVEFSNDDNKYDQEWKDNECKVFMINEDKEIEETKELETLLSDSGYPNEKTTGPVYKRKGGVCILTSEDDDDKMVREEKTYQSPHQELAQREYFIATGVDLGFKELIDVDATKTKLRRTA